LPPPKAIPIPFEMCSSTRVKISLESFWEVAREWAQIHNDRKEEGAYQGLPSL